MVTIGVGPGREKDALVSEQVLGEPVDWLRGYPFPRDAVTQPEIPFYSTAWAEVAPVWRWLRARYPTVVLDAEAAGRVGAYAIDAEGRGVAVDGESEEDAICSLALASLVPANWETLR